MITTSSDYKTIRIVSLMITHSCNLNCVYCFEKHKDFGKRMMSFETAKEVLQKEFDLFKTMERESNDRLAIEFFGGEPMMNFELIKMVYEWVKGLDLPFPMMFQATTNGTLLTESALEWFTSVKNDFRIVVSIDGDELMHAANRGVSMSKIPTDYIVKNWPNSYFKMTISKETLPRFSQGVIELTTKGYRVTSSLAEGIDWDKNDANTYKQELLKIASFYLENPQYKIEQPFDLTFDKLRYDTDVPPKNCGVGTKTLIYDTDGQSYPCHLFVPVVHGQENVRKVVDTIDFYDDKCMINDHCLKCSINKLCRTCYGYNYLDRGDIKSRNLTKCKMLLAELQIISSFQVQYFMHRKESLNLNDIEKLSDALSAYELLHNTEFDFD